MVRVIDAALPLHVWGRAPPPEAIEQLKRVAAQPWAVEHVAAMPDLHVANGIAVGTVFATQDTIVPSALGGDLGCGMSAVPLSPPRWSLDARTLLRILGEWSRAIPVGDATHRGKGVEVPSELFARELSTGALLHARERLSRRHLGTLGGGNHFLELDRDAEGNLWLLVHSGSRGLGAAIAAHHLRAAEGSGFGEIPGLRVTEAAGQACIGDIEWALHFARENRRVLAEQAASILLGVIGAVPDLSATIDVHHNFVRAERHQGRELLIHRKGAIAAERGARALIPGSMGTASYIVEGLGDPSSFASASHGAGRVLTRREARGRIAIERFEHSMRRVVFDARRSRDLVEEAPAAYRDIREVLEDEDDLVRPLIRLEPLAVLKG
jgi:tRNA-splicing ligase RtcB (3'-phosphate/5'-hydroxy nucleic acid ligase)